MHKRARVIYNPTAGRETMRNSLVDILDIYEQAGYETSAFATTPAPNSARNEAERAGKEGFDMVVACGGDGTLNEVVSGLSGLPEGHRPTLAIIPAGTTNDFARALHIPRGDPIAAAKLILKKNKAFQMDVGKAGDNYFMNIAAGGELTELTYQVPSDMKTLFGYLAYIVRGAEVLPRVRAIPMDIKYDGHEFHGPASMVLLALTNSVGGFESIAPDAQLDDGNFTMMIVKQTNMMGLMQLMAKALNGTHIDDPRVIYRKVKHVEAAPIKEDRLMINLDGEYGGDAPMTFDNLHHHLRVIANLDEIPDDALADERDMKRVEKDFVQGMDRYSKKQPQDDQKQ